MSLFGHENETRVGGWRRQEKPRVIDPKIFRRWWIMLPCRLACAYMRCKGLHYSVDRVSIAFHGIRNTTRHPVQETIVYVLTRYGPTRHGPTSTNRFRGSKNLLPSHNTRLAY